MAVVPSQMESNVGDKQRDKRRKSQSGANRMVEKREKQIFNQMELLIKWRQAELNTRTREGASEREKRR